VSYQVLVGVNVLDEAKFSEYLTAVEPLLSTHNGMFCYDYSVHKERHAVVSGNINRVLKFEFADKCNMEKFFTDRCYLKTRGRHVLKAIGGEQFIYGFSPENH